MRTFIVFIVLLFTSCSVYAFEQLIIEPDMGREPILSAIKHAQTSIDVVMYGMTDNEITNALINAKNAGKDLHILLEAHPYKADNENVAMIKQLQAQQVNLQWPSTDFKLTHQKTFIFDHQRALIMTFNLTHSSFKNERNFALLTDNPAMVQEISQVFQGDYQHKNTAVTHSNLVWSPNNSRDKILAFIRSAHSEIKLYEQDISDYQVIGALASAARAGTHVQILLSKPFHPGPNKKLQFLQKAGATIRFSKHYIIHAKVIMVDHQRALLGSINLTKASMNDNRELAVITQDGSIVDKLISTFSNDWDDTSTLRGSHHAKAYHYHIPKKFYRRLLSELNSYL